MNLDWKLLYFILKLCCKGKGERGKGKGTRGTRGKGKGKREKGKGGKGGQGGQGDKGIRGIREKKRKKYLTFFKRVCYLNKSRKGLGSQDSELILMTG